MRVIAGSLNVTTYHYIVGDAGNAAPGDPVAGLLFSNIETGGSASYNRSGAARVDLTLKTQTATGAHDDGGMVLVDNTNMIGVYRVDWPDAAFAVGAREVNLYLFIAAGSNAVTAPIKVELIDPVNQAFTTQVAGATGNDSTHIHVPTWTFGDNEINNDLIAIKDVSESATGPEWFFRRITGWVNSTKLVTFTPALPASVEASVDLITRLGKVDDRFAFTVDNEVDSNAKSIAGVTVIGAGASGNKWRA